MNDSRTSGDRPFLTGVLHALPIVLGYLPIGLSYGVIAQQSGLTTTETVAMSLIVYAGSAQFACVGLLAQGAGLAAIVGTTFLLNLRHLLFSAALSTRSLGQSPARLAVAAFWLTDEVFAIAQSTLGQQPRPLTYLYGLELTAYLAWALASLAGATLGQALSGYGRFGLDYALPAMFIALIALQLPGRVAIGLTVAAVSAAASLGLRSAGLDQVSALLATLVGVGVGSGVEWYGRKSSSSSS